MPIVDLVRHGWSPRIKKREKALYVRDPINHTVDEFCLKQCNSVNRRPTDYVNLGGLNYENRRFHRMHGIGEFADLTHGYRARTNAKGHPKSHFRLLSSEITQYADDAILHHETNPFRSGK